MEGTPFSIEDESMSKKCEALFDILRELEKLNPPKLSIIILIPEGFKWIEKIILIIGVVSYLIGAHGRQINSIMKETGTEIIVN